MGAIGIRRSDGKRLALGVSAAISEAKAHWRAFINSLKTRRIGIPNLVTSDAHEGLKAVLKATFNGTPWPRCQFHLQQNAPAISTWIKGSVPESPTIMRFEEASADVCAHQTWARISTAKSSFAHAWPFCSSTKISITHSHILLETSDEWEPENTTSPSLRITASLTPKTNTKQPLEISLQIHPENFLQIKSCTAADHRNR